MNRLLLLSVLLAGTLPAWGQAGFVRSGFTTNAPGATIDAAGSTVQGLAAINATNAVLNALTVNERSVLGELDTLLNSVLAPAGGDFQFQLKSGTGLAGVGGWDPDTGTGLFPGNPFVFGEVRANTGTFTNTVMIDDRDVFLNIDAKQTGSVNLTNWSALATSAKQDALGFVPQAGSVNLTNWSALAPSAKQDALSVVLQSDAEAGTSTTARLWTPQRVAQAIAALAPDGGSGSGFPLTADGDLAGFSLTGGDTLSATNVVAEAFMVGSDNLVHMINTRATEEYVDNSFMFRGADIISVNSTNEGTKVNFQRLEVTHPISYPPATYTGVNYAWDMMVNASVEVIGTGDVTVTLQNLANAAANYKDGYKLVVTNSTAGPISVTIEGAFPRSDIHPPVLAVGSKITFVLGFDLGTLKYDYSGPQFAVQQTQHGGTGTEYGIVQDGYFPVDRTGTYNIGTPPYKRLDINLGHGLRGYTQLTENTRVGSVSRRTSASLTNLVAGEQVHYFHNVSGSTVYLTNNPAFGFIQTPNPISIGPNPPTNIVSLLYVSFGPDFGDTLVAFNTGASQPGVVTPPSEPDPEPSIWDDAIAYYSFEETATTSVTDIKTGAYPLTPVVAGAFQHSWPGINNNSWSNAVLGASGGQVRSLAPQLRIPSSGTLTMVGWYRPTSITQSGHNPAGVWDTGLGQRWRLSVDTSGGLSLGISTSGSGAVSGATTPFTLVNNTWNLICVMINNTGNVKFVSTPVTAETANTIHTRTFSGTLFETTAPFTLWGIANNDAIANNTRSQWDEVAIFHRELTQPEYDTIFAQTAESFLTP
jgi:hypothetical protein